MERDDHYRRAVVAQRAGAHEKATKEFLIVLSDTRGPGWSGFRHLLMGQIGELIASHPPARDSFARVRDGLDLREAEALRDWLHLNEALGEDGRSVAWFDALPRPLPPEVPRELENPLTQALERRGRWADIAGLHPSPEAELEDWWHRRMAESFEKIRARLEKVNKRELSADAQERVLESVRQAVRDEAAILVRACEAAGRTSEAARLWTRALQLDPTDEMRRALGPARWS